MKMFRVQMYHLPVRQTWKIIMFLKQICNYIVYKYSWFSKLLFLTIMFQYLSQWFWILLHYKNRIGGVIVSVLSLSVVDRGFEPRSAQIKDYEIGICCFSTKYAALRRKSKDWLAQNQNNVSKGSDMSTYELLFQWARTIKIQLSVF